VPRRNDLKKILLIGSGPIIVGQACEFDYSGSQACKALKEEGYEVVLINSNPATIMTDPQMADRTYIEPITPEVVEKIIARERPDAILPTLGGQTGLNVAVFLARDGVYDRYGVEVIGASAEAISRAEDRELFKNAMQEIGLKVPDSGLAHSVEEGMTIAEKVGLPVILRPAFTLGGTGGATAYNMEELRGYLKYALSVSPIGQVLVEQSVLGWKEIEFEVIRDCVDNVILITSMENIDPMGVHTGDSMVVAPAQTLTAREYKQYADYCRRIIRKIGITGGGANIQFGGNPDNGEIVIIEVNPRLSRSSALASKATGYPIARVATKLAVGLTLDEVRNDVTGRTSAFHEPTVDYCVFKIARFTFEKFPQADPTINTSMKSVGEAMSIGRNFKEALQKGIRSLEIQRFGLGFDKKEFDPEKFQDLEEIRQKLRIPNAERLFYVKLALEKGLSLDEIYELSKIDRWFLHNIKEIAEDGHSLKKFKGLSGLKKIPAETLRKIKADGFSDIQLACLTGTDEEAVRQRRKELGIEASFKLVDTCGGEFIAERPYYYSTFDRVNENKPTGNRKIIILGGGPNRIGQGIEFDYCCVHAVFAVKELGYEAIMINSNPETVSTDYDTSDKLYFEPLTREDVLAIVEQERPEGVIVQLGGQTPLNLAVPLEKAGVKILGTSPDSIDRAEDRKRFKELVDKLGLKQAPSAIAISVDEVRTLAQEIGYPVLLRPSYVLGGRAMEIVYDDADVEQFMRKAIEASPERPVLVDKFLEEAIEIDVDCVSDGQTAVIGGIMEHIEEAGIHSGDSACVLPPYTLGDEIISQIKEQTYALARELNVKGLMNVQYAVKDDVVYTLEVNPRASRTVPFVSKATGVPLVNIAAKVMMGMTLKELNFTKEVEVEHTAVKEAVFPFSRFPGVDAILGPEMKSTGEVMGINDTFGVAFLKSQQGAGQILPMKGTVFISLRSKDKRPMIFLAKKLVDLGFNLVGTKGTAKALARNDIPITQVLKVSQGRPNVVDMMKNGEIDLIINTPGGKGTKPDGLAIRSNAVALKVPLITTVAGAYAAVNGIEALKKKGIQVKTIQEYGLRYVNPHQRPRA
jgi:carbamoyl-phosphate synthase large subunit